MAGFNYARAQATAARLIAKFGQQGDILKYRRVNGVVSYSPVSAKLVVLDFETNEIDGTRITRRDRRIYVEAIPEGIGVSDRIRDASGVTYEVIPPVSPLNPGGTVVYFEVQGRI